MRLRDDDLDTYLASVADLLDRYGVELDLVGRDLGIEQTRDSARTFDLRGFLPDAGSSTRAILEIRETWLADDAGTFERAEYAYELLDSGRAFRRAFHLHAPDWFERHFMVLVHEHCERPIGTFDCQHYEGSPLRDAFAGVLALIDAWTDEPPDCDRLRCLEPGVRRPGW
ncbi:MAG TPA: hypothetical protein VM344_01340 [Vitreimonas sp.]|nr:hypothetical protein [Vitreimonas sp.]